MYERINYLVVGIFVVLFTALASYFAFWLAKADMNQRSYNQYIIYFQESVDGLNKDSTVKINGVDAGRVSEIKINPKDLSKVSVKVLIEKNLSITKDMYAILQGQGLTGLRYINIIGGKSKQIIPPNSKDSIIPTKKSLISQLSVQAVQLAQRANTLFSSENLDNIKKILQNGAVVTEKAIEIESGINSIIGESNESLKYNIKDILASLSDLNETIAAYKRLAKSGMHTLNGIDKQVPTLFKSIEHSANSLKKTTNLIQRTIRRGDYNFKQIFTPAVSEVRSLSNDLRELSDEVKTLVQDPTGTLFNGKSLPKGPGE